MASSIQILRSTTAKERPFPGSLLEGQPAVNVNATEPGLFFKASDGSLVKIGPAAITSDGAPPNTGGVGQQGNSIGELWLDKSQNPPVLKVYDGSQWIDAGSGGGVQPGQVTLLRWTVLATAGQTILSGPDSSGQTLAYNAGLEEVYINGAFLRRGIDYTATNGASISLTAPLVLNDEVTVMAWTPFTVVSDIVDADVAADAGIQSSKLAFTQQGSTFTRTVESKFRDLVSVKDFGATGNGLTNDSVAIQAALDSGARSIFFPPGTYLVNFACLVSSNTNLIGAGIGTTILKNPIPGRPGFRNKDFATTGNSKISITGFTFDSNGTADAGIAMTAVDDLVIDKCEFVNIKPIGVTVGIGYGTLVNQSSRNVIITNCLFDVPDYGIVFECALGKGNLSNVTISNCIIKTAWGSGISLSGDISNVSIGECVFELPGDGNSVTIGGPETRVGIGVKLWQGSSETIAPETISITGCTFRGNQDIYQDWTQWTAATNYSVGDQVSNYKKNYVCIAAHLSSVTNEPGVGVDSATYWSEAELTGISAANWTNELTITGNSFRWLSKAFQNDFSGFGADTLVFSSNTVEFCYYGFDNSVSSDVSPVISSNSFRNLDTAIRSSLRYSPVSGNQFRDISSKAISCNSPSEGASFTGNTFNNIGEEAIYLSSGGSSNNLYTITGNYFQSCSTKTNSGFPVIQARTSDFMFNNNVVINEGSNRPSYAIGRPSPNDNNSVITGNWMFGFRLNYLQNTGAGDIYANNKERGGIG